LRGAILYIVSIYNELAALFYILLDAVFDISEQSKTTGSRQTVVSQEIVNILDSTVASSDDILEFDTIFPVNEIIGHL